MFNRVADIVRRLDLVGNATLAYIVVLVFIAIVGPWLGLADPTKISRNVLDPPSSSALLGTDHLGRDQLARMVTGVRVSLVVGFVAATMAIIVGVAIGATAGYLGGRVDMVLMRITEIFQVMPMLIIAVAIVAFIGPGLLNIIGVIALLSWAQTARVMRSEVLRVRNLGYVDAVRCLGYPERTLLLREVVPNALPAVMPLIALCVAAAILQEASISFLGLGSPDTITWGLLLHEGQKQILRAWWLTVFPGLAVFATVLAFNLFGDAVGHALNPRRAEKSTR